MRLLHLMAVRAFRERGLRQMIVCPASAGAALGMASFWIRHRTTPLFSIPTPPFRISRPERKDPVFSCTPFSGVLGREARISAQNSFQFKPLKNTHKHTRVNRNAKSLLFLKPVLLQPRQGSQSR